MKAPPRAATVALAVVLPASLCVAQGLGDAAARERARRETQAQQGAAEAPRYGNEDLDQGRPAEKKKSVSAGVPASAPEGRASREEQASREESEGSRTAQAEAAPSGMDEVAARERAVAGLEAELQTLQAKLNPMSGSFIYGGTGSNDPAEEARVRSRLPVLEQELARARQTLAEARDAAERRGRERPPDSE